MQEESGLLSLSTSDDKEVISRLRASGAKGRVSAILDERMLSLETKTGQVLSVKLDNISRADHHHTTLIPFTYAFIGAMLVLISIRNLVDPTAKAAFLTLGISLVFGHIVTRRPTLTITYNDEDCYAIHGPDSKLMDMTYLIQRLREGLSLDDARAGLQTLNQDTDFPMTSVIAEEIKEVKLRQNPNIGMFLEQEPEEDEEDSEFMFPQLLDEPSGEQVLQSFESERTTQRRDGLKERALRNIETRRNYLTVQIPTEQLMPPRQEETYPVHGNDFLINEFNFGGFGEEQTSASENAMDDMFGFDFGQSMDSEPTIPEPEPIIPRQINQESHVQPTIANKSSAQMIREARNERNYVPSFANQEGFHIPNTQEEYQPPNDHNMISNQPESRSIVRDAMRSGSAQNDSQISNTSSNQKVLQKKKRRDLFVKKSQSSSKNSTFVKKSSAPNTNNRISSVGSAIVNSISGIRNRNSSDYAQEYSDDDSQVAPGQTVPNLMTNQYLKLRASQDGEAMVGGLRENIENLSVSRGGIVENDVVSEMYSHLGNGVRLDRRVEGDRLKELEEVNLGDFEQLNAESSSNKSGIGGLKRLD